MIKTKNKNKDMLIEKRQINISSKRQITIPVKYYEALGLDKELDCIYSNGMLILTPIQNNDPALTEHILADLITQGYTGEDLLNEFKKINRKARPAVEKIIEEANMLAMAASQNYVDPTDSIFGTDESEDQ